MMLIHNNSRGNHARLDFSPILQREERETSDESGKNFLLAVTAAVTGDSIPGVSEAVQKSAGHHEEEVLTWGWFFGQLPSFRLIPATCSIIAMFMIVRYLKTVRGMMIRTHFQIYCLILSCSDFCISIAGFCTSLGIVKFMQMPWLSTL